MASSHKQLNRKRRASESDEDFESDALSSEVSEEQEVSDESGGKELGLVSRLRAEIAQLQKENQQLKKRLCTGPQQPSATALPKFSAEASKQIVDKLRKSILQQVEGVMVYRKSLKHSKSRINVQVPNLTVEQVRMLLGSELSAAATNGPKQLQAKLSNDDLTEVLGSCPSKRLRYGAHLGPIEGTMKLTYNKAEATLTLSGFYTM